MLRFLCFTIGFSICLASIQSDCYAMGRGSLSRDSASEFHVSALEDLPYELKMEVVQYLEYWDLYMLSQASPIMREFLISYHFPVSQFEKLNQAIDIFVRAKINDLTKTTNAARIIGRELKDLRVILKSGTKLNSMENTAVKRLERKLEKLLDNVPSYWFHDDLRIEEKIQLLKTLSNISILNKKFKDLIDEKIKGYRKLGECRPGESYPGEFFQMRKFKHSGFEYAYEDAYW